MSAEKVEFASRSWSNSDNEDVHTSDSKSSIELSIQDYDVGTNLRGGGFGSGLHDKSVRMGFIRKVYLILCFQFAVTLGTVLGMRYLIGENFENNDSLQSMIFIIMWVCLAVFFITEIVLLCCDAIRRKHPINLILLLIFTLAMAGFVGCVTLYYSIDAVLIAMGSTCIITLGLTLFACQTKWDFTGMGAYIFNIFLVFFCFGFFMIFFHSKVLQVVYGCCGVLIFSMFLVYDTQLLVGGGRYQIGEEEYVYGALTLYIDVIGIFMHLLGLLGNN